MIEVLKKEEYGFVSVIEDMTLNIVEWTKMLEQQIPKVWGKGFVVV